MSSNRAQKAAIRAAQLPGENYTTALRRLTANPADATGPAPIRWEESGAGLGTWDFSATVDGIELTCSFFEFADHKLTGFYALGHTDTEDKNGFMGRFRFPDGNHDDDQPADLLAGISAQVREWLATGILLEQTRDELTSDAHGDPVTPADLRANLFPIAFIRWGATPGDWDVVELDDLGDDEDEHWRPHSDVAQDGMPELLTYDAAAGTWTTPSGAPVEVFAV